MKRQEKQLYSTGDFADYFGVRKDTLLYYDKIGLFRPAFVKPNGYRCYTAAQIASFGTLLSLREMHIPIKQIKAYFNDPSPARLMEIAREQTERLQAEVKRLQQIKRLFAKIMRMTAEAQAAKMDELEIQTLPPARFLYSRPNTAPDKQTSDQQWWEIVSGFMRQTGAAGAVSIGSVIAKKDLQTGQFSRIDRLFMESDRRSGIVRPAGQYAILYHRGDFEELAGLYPDLLAQIRRRGFYPTSGAWEEYLVNELAAAQPQAYVTKITIAVCPMTQGSV